MQNSLGTSRKSRDKDIDGFRYAVVTPARNEETYIEETIQSVICQTVLPQRYVLVSDGSTDRTDEIMQHYADEHDFITFVRAGGVAGDKKCFGSKVRAFNAGFAQLKGVDYDFIGNLDADISFEPDYFQRLLAKFEGDQKLGLAGGAILEMIGGRPVERNASIESVCGAVQLFRRACYEEIGGYTPLDRGGVDAAAEIMARMKGWRVRHQPDLPVIANRPVQTGHNTLLGTRYNKGVVNYLLGYHPLFQLAVSARFMTVSPWVIGGLWMLAGYAISTLQNKPRVLSKDVVTYLRAEQLSRLGLHLRKKTPQ